MQHLRLICTLFLLAIVSAGFAYSQAVNGTLLGTVTDPSGAVVPNAKVTVTEVNTNVSHSSQTNESGNFQFPDLPPGKYAITVEQTGFKKEARRNVDLLVNS